MKRRLVLLITLIVLVLVLAAPAGLAALDHGGSGTEVPTWQAGFTWADGMSWCD